MKLDEGTLQSAQVQVNYTRITAPITGRVGLRLVDPGNIVHATDTNGLLVITQMQPITVEFSIAEDYLSEVLAQMRAGHTLRVDALDRDQQTELSQGSLLTVDNQIDASTGTVRLRAIFANRDNKLFPNQFVNAKLLVRTLRNVNLIPTAAIQRNSQAAFVFVINPNNTVQTRNVTVATTEANTAAVTGVNPGEKLVTDGFDKLEDGTKISVRPPARGPNQLGSAEARQEAQQNPSTQGAAATNLNPSQGKARRGRRTRGKSSEPFAPIHSQADCDIVIDARDFAGRNRGLQTAAGVGSARSGLPHDAGGDLLSGREPGRDGFRGDRAARAAVRTGSGIESDDFDELGRLVCHHAAICAQPEYRCRRAGSTGGDQRGANLSAHRFADASGLQQEQSRGYADSDAGADFEDSAAEPSGRRCRHATGAKDLATCRASD